MYIELILSGKYSFVKTIGHSHNGFHKKGNVVARGRYSLAPPSHRSGVFPENYSVPVREIASGWKKHPALATTQSILWVTGFCENLGTPGPMRARFQVQQEAV